MERRVFGSTGLLVPVVGLGAGQIGERDVSDADAAAVLNGALDLGVTLIDTAHSYGASEERIGRHLEGRRDEFVLSTKGGAGVEGHADWSPGRRDGDHRAVAPADALGAPRRLPPALLSRGGAAAGRSPGHPRRRRGGREGRRRGLQRRQRASRGRGRIGAVRVDRDEHQHRRPVEPPFRRRAPSRARRDRQAADRERAVALRRAPRRGLQRALLGAAPAARVRPGRAGLGGARAAIHRVRARRPLRDRRDGQLQNLVRNLEAAERGPLPDDLLQQIDERWTRVGTDWPAST